MGQDLYQVGSQATEPMFVIQVSNQPVRFSDSYTLDEIETLCSRSQKRVYAQLPDGAGSYTLREVGLIGSTFVATNPSPPAQPPQFRANGNTYQMSYPEAPQSPQVAYSEPTLPTVPIPDNSGPKPSPRPPERQVSPYQDYLENLPPSNPALFTREDAELADPRTNEDMEDMSKKVPSHATPLQGGGSLSYDEVIPGNPNDPANSVIGPEALQAPTKKQLMAAKAEKAKPKAKRKSKPRKTASKK